MVDNILEKITEIKNRSIIIKNKLLEIPKQRSITCTYKEIKSNPPTWIYRPRFNPKNKSIPQKLKLEFIQLIDDINLYLKKFSPDEFINITDIIDLSSENKYSILFLLEKDVYNTDMVYGDYLVEQLQDQYEINYYRWHEKKRNLPNQALSIDLTKFVINDAILQIQTQFDHLWSVLENEIKRCENFYHSLKSKENGDKSSFIKKLLETKECEFLDFKLAIYSIFPKKSSTGLEQRKEFLKDVIALINNKRSEKNDGKAYILIGVGEKNEKYDGIHKKIDYDDYITLNQLINEYITPKLDVEFDEYYIFGDKNNILISINNIEGYDRNILFTLFYEVGTVYEISKRIGNPNIDVKYYNEGTSFTRDGSITRRLRQEDRERIISLKTGKNGKYLDVELRKFGYFLIVKAVNKSERPLVITQYRFLFPSYSIGEGIDGPYTSVSLDDGIPVRIKSKEFLEAVGKATENLPLYREIVTNTENYPITLKDGESLSRSVHFGVLIHTIEEGLKEGLQFNLNEVKCCFNTNDGRFCSKTINIKADIEGFIQQKNNNNFAFNDLFEEVHDNHNTNQEKLWKRKKKEKN